MGGFLAHHSPPRFKPGGVFRQLPYYRGYQFLLLQALEHGSQVHREALDMLLATTSRWQRRTWRLAAAEVGYKITRWRGEVRIRKETSS